MTAAKLAPMPKHSTQVQETRNYSIFKLMDGNRTTNSLHLNRLKESMSERFLFSPIIVNEKYEVIDGQHRLYCCRELGLPVYYLICRGYGLREVQILNVNAKNWNSDDFLSGYCDLGYQDYIVYKQFKEHYDFGHTECMIMLGGLKLNNSGACIKSFQNGDFKVVSLKKAEACAEKILQIAPYYTGYKRRSFIYAMIHMLQNKAFDFNDFIKKLKQQTTKMVDCATTAQYKQLIEEIYNYRRQEKVSLKY